MTAVRTRVERAFQAGEACWCSMVRLELRNGAGGEREKKVLRDFERLLPELSEVGKSKHCLIRRDIENQREISVLREG